MISNYEIRENSLTQNSIYILLINADEQGRANVEHKFAGHCKLIDAKVSGFDYVFELSGISDESSLESIKTKLETLSSRGITQTFDNEQKKKENTTINLADTGFPISLESSGETSFKDLPTSGSLVSGDEKRIDIEGTSLELAQTIPDIKRTTSNSASDEIYRKLSGMDQQNKTEEIPSLKERKKEYREEEKSKTKIFGTIFGKLKTAIHTKKDHKEKTFLFKKKTSIPELNEKKEQVLQEINDSLKKEVPVSSQGLNPFQDLGEGLIIKKSTPGKKGTVTETIEGKKDMRENSITAKIQVDDIFAAETVCDFYENPQENITKDVGVVVEENKTPLDMLENPPVEKKKQKSMDDTCVLAKENLIKISSEKKSDDMPLHSVKIKDPEVTLPDQILVQKTLENKKETIDQSEEKDIIEAINEKEKERPVVNNSTKNENVLIKNVEENKEELKREKQSMKDNFEEVNKNMKDEIKEISEVSIPQKQSRTLGKAVLVKNNDIKRTMNIDHTLHVATPSKDAKYRNYPIEMPLVPTYTFSNMDISSVRFAHAMAMSTLDDLGRTNNPFLLQGPSGTGKTHFLHAMGYEISKKIPQAKILFTNGVRFSRGVQYLLEKGQKEKLDTFFGNAEVLIIDDVHLTAVNEHNREYISKVLNDFLKNKKQIILSSKYPPESLKRFEELVNFKFSTGTIAELKVPTKTHFEKLTNKIVTASFLDLTEKQVQTFFSQKNTSLGDVARNVKRVKVLSRRIESSGIKQMSYEEILKEMTGINGEDSESEIVKKDFGEITALERNKEISWGNFGFFFPASQIDKFRWVAFAAQEAAKELGIKGGFNYALKSAYSTDHIISAAFKIANICDLKGLKGAVILGPSFMECKEPIRDNFYDILTHMLEVMMIRCGTINFEDIKKPSAYIKMLGDILR